MKAKLLASFIIGSLVFIVQQGWSQSDLQPVEIVQKAMDRVNGKTSQGEMKMTIQRPDWSREMTMKSWGLGDDLMLILVTGPARDKGSAFLKRGNEIWNWQPTIDRVIKLPPSMMAQSWMGSDFTNDDLVKQSSMADDFTHKMLNEEEVEGRACYAIEMIPKPDAAVVWGKVVVWIDKTHYMQMKIEFYDEDEFLVNTMLGKNVKKLGGKLLPSLLEVIPVEEPENRTLIEQLSIRFDEPIKDAFFSVQNMKRVR